MPDQKTTQLPLLTVLAGTQILPIVDDPGGSPISKRVTVSTLLNPTLMATTPAGTIAASNVQAALNELDTDKANKIVPATAGNLAQLSAGGDLQDAGISPLLGFMRVASYVYDFSVQGGAIGTVTLTAERGQIPNNAIIWSGCIDRLTTLTSSGSATIALQANTAGDLLAATAFGGFTAPGRSAIIPVGSAASSVKTTAIRDVQLTIATAALTAGRFRVILFYTPSA